MREEDIEDQWKRIGQVIIRFGSLATYQSAVRLENESLSQKERHLGWSRGDLEWGMRDLNFSEEDKRIIRDFVDGKNKEFEEGKK